MGMGYLLARKVWLQTFPRLQKVFLCFFTLLAGSGINVHLQKGFKGEEGEDWPDTVRGSIPSRQHDSGWTFWKTITITSYTAWFLKNIMSFCTTGKDGMDTPAARLRCVASYLKSCKQNVKKRETSVARYSSAMYLTCLCLCIACIC